MPASQFSFDSPGVKFQELDQSVIPAQATQKGPIIIGLSQRGPAFQPITVKSFDEFVQVFGDTVPGGQSGDIWRDGNYTAPLYAPYAMQSWLQNGQTATFIKLLGSQHSEANTANGYSGWKAGNITQNAGGGAYGLFIFPSSSTSNQRLTGSLAAVFYCPDSYVQLTNGEGSNSSAAFYASSTTGDFTIRIASGSGAGTTVETKTFSMDPSNAYFIRKVFNTNPQNTNTDIVSTVQKYWLGETFENDFAKHLYRDSTAYTGTDYYGVVLGLKSGSLDFSDHTTLQYDDYAKTGWIISQDTVSGTNVSFTPQSMTKLFRFVDRGSGDWLQSHAKVSIANIRLPQNEKEDPWATFDVIVRKISDTDANVKIIERFNDCNLNPSSEKYIAAKIGDKYLEYDETDRRWSEKGSHRNKSKYMIVEVNPDLESSPNSALFPYGCLGPIKFADMATDSVTSSTYTWAKVSGSIGGTLVTSSGQYVSTGSFSNINSRTMKYIWPSMMTRLTSSADGLSSPKQAFFGVWSGVSLTSTDPNKGIVELVREMPKGFTSHVNASETISALYTYSWTFSLDNIVETGTVNKVYSYSETGKYAGSSVSANSGSDELLSRGINKFTTVFYGGSNGWDVTESLPVANRLISENPTPIADMVYNVYQQAFDMVQDPEDVQGNLISSPGLTHKALTGKMLDLAEQRGDCMAVIDLEQSFYPTHEKITAELDPDSGEYERGNVDQVISDLNDRAIDNTFGASYFPWVQIRDKQTSKLCWVPSSVVALGTMAYTDKVQYPWFAPAGFNRGGLVESNVGLNVVDVARKLNADDRNKLQIANINPIAKFPKEGIVVWGQKTLTPKSTALNRVNVRRLALFVKDGVEQLLNQFIFEPNLEDTWVKAKKKVDPFLADIKAKMGFVDVKFVLDETTTTPDLVDQNMMYAKIWIKPAKAIEYIAVDLVIVNSGASF